MLCASPLPGSYTGDAIWLKCVDMLDKWGIKSSELHCFVTDNAANMEKAMTDGGYTNVGYFAYTLQLVIHVQIHDSLCIKEYTAGIKDFLNSVDYLRHYEGLSFNAVSWLKHSEQQHISDICGEVDAFSIPALCA